MKITKERMVSLFRDEDGCRYIRVQEDYWLKQYAHTMRRVIDDEEIRKLEEQRS
jgi:hypothetical protein